MTFKGRYYTENNTCVAVHKWDGEVDVPYCGEHQKVEYWGHEVRLGVPYKDDRKFFWNGEGKCLSVIGTVDDVSKFNLRELVRAATYAAQIEVVDCEKCREDRPPNVS